jgi:peptidoglycan/xylan/chitin deacetylase (PgdA/CDA1 family)
MKFLLRGVIASGLHRSGVLHLHRRWRLRNRAVILMYHRVLKPEERSSQIHAGMYVLASAFERHHAYLQRSFELVDLDTMLAWLEGRIRCRRPPCAITFDDGWCDNYRNAFPLLRQFGAPATIFLITEQVGRPGMLTWAEIREMESAGVRFASHTATHPNLTELQRDDLERELVTSKEQLERHVATPSRWFCYPRGQYDDRAMTSARKYYTAAVTTERDTVSKQVDRFRIPRIGVHHDIAATTSQFAFRLSLIG